MARVVPEELGELRRQADRPDHAQHPAGHHRERLTGQRRDDTRLHVAQARAAGYAQPVSVQNAYNLLQRHYELGLDEAHVMRIRRAANGEALGKVTWVEHLGDQNHLHTGLNSFLGSGYLPPDPPPGHGPHRYVAQIYALNAASGFKGPPGRPQVRDLLHKHAVARGMICATYVRH